MGAEVFRQARRSPAADRVHSLSLLGQPFAVNRGASGVLLFTVMRQSPGREATAERLSRYKS